MDPYERLVIEKHGITAFGIEDIEHYGNIFESVILSYVIENVLYLGIDIFSGIHNVLHMALNKIDPHNEKSLHVSFDIDSLDPLEAPSTGTPGTSSVVSQKRHLVYSKLLLSYL